MAILSQHFPCLLCSGLVLFFFFLFFFIRKRNIFSNLMYIYFNFCFGLYSLTLIKHLFCFVLIIIKRNAATKQLKPRKFESTQPENSELDNNICQPHVDSVYSTVAEPSQKHILKSTASESSQISPLSPLSQVSTPNSPKTQVVSQNACSATQNAKTPNSHNLTPQFKRKVC